MNPHEQFWREHPALLLAISFLIGSAVSLYSFPLWYALPWIVYCACFRRWASAVTLPLAAIYSFLLWGHMPEIKEPKFCTAPLSVSHLQVHQSPFHRDLQLRGTLFHEGAQLPCTIYLPLHDRIKASCDYTVTGYLEQKGPYEYGMKVKRWEPIPYSWSLAELRYQTKESFRKFLKEKLSHPRTAVLLSSLATGEVDDRLLRFEFGRLGLQHILAISGFHFGILVACCSLALGLFLPVRLKWIALLALMTLYYLFIGSSPAVQRAYFTASLYLLSRLLQRNTSSINLLGASLLIELILNPLAAANLGFQLSFVCSFGLLLLYQPIESLLRPLFLPSSREKRPLIAEALTYVSSTFRSAISLTLAVNLAIFPLLLYHFGKFPYLSLVYNLFFPFLISLALIGLIASLLLHILFAPLATPLFSLLNAYTQNLLQLTTYPPLPLDYSLFVPEFSFLWIPLYLFSLFLLSLHTKQLKSPSPYL